MTRGTFGACALAGMAAILCVATDADGQDRSRVQGRVISPPADQSGSHEVAVAGVLLPAARSIGLWFVDPLSQKKHEAKPGSAEGTWSIGPLYDVPRPRIIHVAWLPVGLSDSEVAGLLGNGAWKLSVTLNGQPLQRGPDGTTGDYWATELSTGGGCPSGRTCLAVSVQGATWFAGPSPWMLQIQVTPKPDGTRLRGPPTGDPMRKYPSGDAGSGMSASTTVALLGPDRSYFADFLAGTFRHERCSRCHSLGSPKLLSAHHEPLDIGVSVTPTNGGSILTCNGGCHSPESRARAAEGARFGGVVFTETEWKVPAKDLDIDWYTKTVPQICQRVRTRLPTDAALKKHFHEDARLAWAIESGRTPNGNEYPTAPPHDFLKFLDIVDLWIDNGFPCPK